jgi:DDE superfamily endonuclease
MTQPTTTTWGAVGCPRVVPYEAPQGRRLNAIGGYFSAGPRVGDFEFGTFASVPKPKRRANGTFSKPLAQVALEHGLTEEDLGVIDSEVFLGFIWHLGVRPVDAPPNWRRERPLIVWIDNYSVHKSERVRLERRALKEANIELRYLPPYSPGLSRIEPQWKITKYHGLWRRSCGQLGELKQAVETALTQRRMELRMAHAGTDQ